MTKKITTPLAAAVGAAFVASAALAPLTHANGSNPFAATELTSGYNLASKHGEGKCGEGKCGDMGHAKKGMEGACGESKSKMKEGRCGEDKAAGEHKSMGEGKCGEKKAIPEGKCGEGKCGEGKCGAK